MIFQIKPDNEEESELIIELLDCLGHRFSESYLFRFSQNKTIGIWYDGGLTYSEELVPYKVLNLTEFLDVIEETDGIIINYKE